MTGDSVEALRNGLPRRAPHVAAVLGATCLGAYVLVRFGSGWNWWVQSVVFFLPIAVAHWTMERTAGE